MLCAVPLLVQKRRSWLGAFILAHLALLVCLLSAVSHVKEGAIYFDYASLDRLIGAATANWYAALSATATMAFLVICPLNYLFYLKARSARLSTQSGQDSHQRSHRCICSYSTVLCHLMSCYRMAAGFLAARQSRPSPSDHGVPHPSAV
jgi:hypothetical protein